MPKIIKEVQEFWNNNPCDGYLKSANDRMNTKYIKNYYVPKILNLINKQDTVLEIGCGQGSDLLNIAYRIDTIPFGVDISNKSVNNARVLIKANKKHAVIMVMNAEELKFLDNTFSFVYSMGVLHHSPDTKRAFNEAERVLCKEGHGIIMVYNKYSPQFIGLIILRFIAKPFNKLIHKWISGKQHKTGTFFQELFLCPIIQGFTNKQLKQMLPNSKVIWMRNYQTGFIRLNDIIKSSFWSVLESWTEKYFGLMKIVYFEKVK